MKHVFLGCLSVTRPHETVSVAAGGSSREYRAFGWCLKSVSQAASSEEMSEYTIFGFLGTWDWTLNKMSK